MSDVTPLQICNYKFSCPYNGINLLDEVSNEYSRSKLDEVLRDLNAVRSNEC